MSANGTRITPGSVRVQVSTCLALCGCLLLALGAQSAQTRYEYDALGRVSSATFSDDSQVAYKYDPAGNRTEVVRKTDVQPPGRPGPPRFPTLTQNSVVVEWDAVLDNRGVARYEYRRGSNDFVPSDAMTRLELQELTAWTNYSIEVRAVDTSDNPGPPRSGSFKTPDTQAPTAPGVPTVRSLTMNSVTMDWAASSDNAGIDQYQYSLNSGSYVSNGTSSSLTLSSLSLSRTIRSMFELEIMRRISETLRELPLHA